MIDKLKSYWNSIEDEDQTAIKYIAGIFLIGVVIITILSIIFR